MLRRLNKDRFFDLIASTNIELLVSGRVLEYSTGEFRVHPALAALVLKARRMTDFVEEPAFEIGRRLEMRGPYAWFVVLKPPAEAEPAIDTFVAELSAVLDQPVRVIRGTALSLEQLRTELNAPASDPVLMSDLDNADADLWRALDINRWLPSI